MIWHAHMDQVSYCGYKIVLVLGGRLKSRGEIEAQQPSEII